MPGTWCDSWKSLNTYICQQEFLLGLFCLFVVVLFFWFFYKLGLEVLLPQTYLHCCKPWAANQVFWMHTYPVKVQHQKRWCTAHKGKVKGQRSRVLPVCGWWSVSQCFESHLHIPKMEQVRSRTDQSRKPCFALTVIITRFYTILLPYEKKWVFPWPQLKKEKLCQFTSWGFQEII